MISRSKLLAILLCSSLMALPAPAFAGPETVLLGKDIRDATDKVIQDHEMQTTEIQKSIEENFKRMARSQMMAAKRQMDENKESISYESLPAIATLPIGISTSDAILEELMKSRLGELNRIPLPDEKAAYLLNTGWTAPVNLQQFDIFMRYFCDPDSNAGKIESTTWALTDIPADNSGTRKLNYTLGCGYVKGDPIETRETLIGLDKNSEEAKQLIGLPLRPGDLFFSLTSYPTLPSKYGGSAPSTETNRAAHVYYGAFFQSLQFLVGSAPGNGGTVEGKAEITRQMLASLPFAILFSERVGTMGPEAAKALSNTLQLKLGPAANEESIAVRMRNIQRRQNISLAEYMDIMMYQVPMSPGYYTRISEEFTPAQLRREEVWLTAMQTALNYQRNRWLEILTSLEAVKR